MATTGQVLGTRNRVEVLSQEEIALLTVVRSSGRRIDAEEAAQRTGLPKGLAALGLELLVVRELI
ncbi:MAG TPA: hypothetical protein VFB78_00145 [Acidimicrobiales bacterium]|jgi:hypothetical protein|nr:hypothetical protein [Acidimicrobiales bacterium]